MKTNKNLKPIKLLKTKKKPSLFSYLNKIREDKKELNIISLANLFKGKNIKDFHKVKSFCGLNINENKNEIISNKFKNNSLKNCKSLSHELLPIKYTKLKLPKIKRSKEIETDVKKSKIESIMNKFHKYDYEFKTESKNSFDFNNLYYLKYNYDFSNLNIQHTYDYKKIFSRLFKRIKGIKSI